MTPQDSPPYGTPVSPTDKDNGRWLTFAELAAVRGISKASAIKLVRRHGWRRQPGNEGHVRALVPTTWAVGGEGSADSPADSPRDSPPDTSHAINALEAANAALQERARAADARAERAEAEIDRTVAELQAERGRVDTERARADRAEQGRDGERARADALRDRLEVLQAHAEERAGRAENDVFELKGQLATAQSAAAEAGREAEAARLATHAFLDEDAARRRLGRLARLRAAWRGE